MRQKKKDAPYTIIKTDLRLLSKEPNKSPGELHQDLKRSIQQQRLQPSKTNAMKTKVNINEREWCNLVFEGKNKNYGAFAIRLHSDEQKVRALFITISVAVVIAIYPLLTGKSITDLVIPTNDIPVTISNLPDPPQDVIKTPEPEKPIRPKASIAFTPPVITNTSDDPEPPSQEELVNTKKFIGTAIIDGDLPEPGELNNNGNTGKSKKDETFKAVEKMPQFPGGPDALMKFLKKNLRYPEIAQENYIQGKVYAQFIVDKTGKITDLKIIKGLDKSCDDEALRIINLMPDWMPGMQNGTPVAVYFTLPVAFQLGSR